MRLTCWHCLRTSSRIFFSQSRTIRLDSDMKISFSTSLYPFSLCASCFTTIRKFWGEIIASWGQTLLVHRIWPFFMKYFPGHLHRRFGKGILQVLVGWLCYFSCWCLCKADVHLTVFLLFIYLHWADGGRLAKDLFQGHHWIVVLRSKTMPRTSRTL